MPDDIDMDAIEGRLTAATPGPWRCWNGFAVVGETARKHDVMAVNRIGPDDGVSGILGGWSEDGDLYARRADAEFVAMAPTDIADLIAEVRRLRDGADR